MQQQLGTWGQKQVYCRKSTLPFGTHVCTLESNSLVHIWESAAYWLGAQNLPARQETLVWFLSGKDPLEKGIGYPLQYSWASLVAQMVKNLPAMQETWVRSLGWKDPLEKGMAAHSSTLAWRSPWNRQVVGYSPWGCKESDVTDFHFHLFNELPEI